LEAPELVLTNFFLVLVNPQEHPELLADVMKAMEVRLDHARVVLMFRKEGALPLIKDYLLNVQKTNILEVSEIVDL
jgi:clathrin heavy chain